MTPKQKRLTIAIYTANQWSSDQPGKGLSLLSLGSTRTVHSEEHRQELIKEIDSDLAYNRQLQAEGFVDQWNVNIPEKDIPRLEDLKELVLKAKIGKAWMTDDENMRWNENLYRRGKL